MDVGWKCLSEQFKYVILISLEQFQLDPSVPYDDLQVIGCSDFVPNASFSISPSPNHIQASKGSVAICDILTPPPELSGSGVVTSKVLSNDRWVQEDKTYCATSESFMNRVKSELENHSGSLSLLIHENYLKPT